MVKILAGNNRKNNTFVHILSVEDIFLFASIAVAFTEKIRKECAILENNIFCPHILQ